ncbi:DUF3080 family protein [Pseudidiomarina sp. E22-M8]|uniref:DUF3080 family protein n=1 Tax=Pseudidiomarina sp. E22-M8 TaxID=3424768 RepID=UPI00403CA17A
MMKRHPRQFVNGRIVRFYQRFCYALCGIGVIVLLTGCSKTPSALAPLIDYQGRVANTLERAPIAYQAIPVPRLPEVRDLRVEIPRVSISLLDSWRIEECAASLLIAERNSALGKLEGGLSRYHTDLKLVTRLQDCVTKFERNDSALAKRLATALQAKRDNLPAAKQHAIATDKALRHTLRVAGNTLTTADSERFASALTALETVLRLMQKSSLVPMAGETTTLPSQEQVEQALKTLHQSDYLPRLWRTLFEQYAYLQRLDPLIANLTTASGCSSVGIPQRAKILHTVFVKFFIAKVQPQLARFTEQGYAINQRLQHLNAQVALPALNHHIQQLIEISTELNQASRQHVQPWQDFFAACGFTPGD